MDIFYLLLKANFLVKTTVIMLLFLSIISWSIVIFCAKNFSYAIRELESFECKFWSGIELSQLYKESIACHNKLSGAEQIFYSGFKEFIKLNKSNSYTPEKIIEGVSCVMLISMNKELELLETNIPFLGTIGSISPYIGLFGTVWGVIYTFLELKTVKQATLQVVAPNIAEALVTTAIGLFTAIPAVVAFNYFNSCINKLAQNYDNFNKELIAVLYYRVSNKDKKVFRDEKS